MMIFQKHTFLSLLVVILLGSGCRRKAPTEKIEDNIIEKEKSTVIEKNKKKSISVLNPLWKRRCSVLISRSSSSLDQLKIVANSLGISLNVNIQKEVEVTYCAQNKQFIDILLDICDLANLKLSIDGTSAILQEDIEYLMTYKMGNLAASIGTEFLTTVDHSLGDPSKGNISKNSYKNSSNYYEIMEKHLAVIVKKPYSFVIDAESGVITVVAPQSVQKKVSLHLQAIKARMNDQILVEVKLLEVELFDEFVFGINFDQMKAKLVNNLNISFSDTSMGTSALTFASSVTDEVLKSSILTYLSTFGKATSLSNPYLVISNNHVGIFKAVENRVYFKFKSETTISSKDKDIVNKQSEFVTYPVGVTFSVHGASLENGLIKLYIKPTITEVSQEIEDAGYQYVKGSNSSAIAPPKVPIIKTREMETVLVLRDGEYAIIG